MYHTRMTSTWSHRLLKTAALDAALAGGCLIWVASIALHSKLDAAAPFLIASMGAAAVLLFVAPQSPMAQPWSLFGGNLLSAIVGVTVARLSGGVWWAGPLAVGVAIFVMHVARCQHPPGGATALFAVMAPQSVLDLGYDYVLNPVFLNVASFFAYFFVAQRLRTRLVAERAFEPISSTEPSVARLRLQPDDLRYAVRNAPHYVDASEHQLLEIANLALIHHSTVHLTGKPLPPAAEENRPRVEFGTSLEDCWRLMDRSGFDNLPVLDRAGRLLGVVRRESLRRLATEHGADVSSPSATIAALRPVSTPHTIRPEAAGQMMESATNVAPRSADQAEACRQMLGSGASFVAIVDESKRYVGLVTSRLLRPS